MSTNQSVATEPTCQPPWTSNNFLKVLQELFKTVGIPINYPLQVLLQACALTELLQQRQRIPIL